jgi:hypothetical protein
MDREGGREKLTVTMAVSARKWESKTVPIFRGLRCTSL